MARAVALAVLFIGVTALAKQGDDLPEFRFAKIIGNNMVVQQGKPERGPSLTGVRP